MQADADVFFEASWEVCNKVGGIYTVIMSKTALLSSYYKDFYLIGPYFVRKVSGQFAEEAIPPDFKPITDILKPEGIIVHFGKWLIPGNPNVFLLDFAGAMGRKDILKGQLWERYGIDSMGAGYDFDEPVVWSYCVGRLIQELSAKPLASKKIVAQFHEWLSGTALLHLKYSNARVGTVFTTHATMLGRSLAGSGFDLYGKLKEIDPPKSAHDCHIQAKFHMEQQCAKYSDAFTTVSEITGIEAEALLGTKPDVILPNGLDIDKFPTFEDASIKHKHFKEQIRDYVMAHFFPYYSFDIGETLLFFLAGRYEFHTKGIDIFIDSLAELNRHMKEINSTKTVIAFFFVPGNIKHTKLDIIESKSIFRDIKDYFVTSLPDIKNKLIYSILSKKPISNKTLFDDEFLDECNRKVHRFFRQGDPPICTHDLHDDDTDAILSGFRSKGLTNKAGDKVKVIFYPIYLTGTDGLLDTDYYETMTGCHVGVFPSYYEPWGYTPLEAGALGISAITTDLSGFGMYVKKEVEGLDYSGIYVLDRLNKGDGQVTSELADFFKKYVSLTRQERIENKINARKIASKADWKFLITEYIKAHNFALGKLN